LELPELEEVLLIRRYKRFLADIETSDGRKETIYCPNTGAMTDCDKPNSRAWMSFSDNPRRKYSKTLEFVETKGGIVGIRSALANQLVEEAISNNVLSGLKNFGLVKAEPKIPDEAGRFDFLYADQYQSIFIEVKSVTWLLDKGVGVFPDTISERASRHLYSLRKVKDQGSRAMLLFCSQNTGIKEIRAAKETDPNFFNALGMAIDKGVEVRGLGCSNDLRSYSAAQEIPFKLT